MNALRVSGSLKVMYAMGASNLTSTLDIVLVGGIKLRNKGSADASAAEPATLIHLAVVVEQRVVVHGRDDLEQHA